MLIFAQNRNNAIDNMTFDPLLHTAGLDTIFVQIYMDALPGVPGVLKNQNFFFTNKTVEFLR
jgi:hypothetical protein